MKNYQLKKTFIPRLLGLSLKMKPKPISSLKLSWLIPIAIICTMTISSLFSNVKAQTTNSNGALTVRSDVQEANSETGVITARGNVKIEYRSRNIQATAAQAQYFSRERRLVLSGNVFILQDGNSLRAETITYLIDEERFIATPQKNQQVESIYIVSEPPNEQSEILNEQ